MKPGRRHPPCLPSRCRGMMLLTAIFIIVVLGLLAAFLTQSLVSQYASGSLTQLLRQSEYAAASGVEWGRERALGSGVCGTGQIQIAEFTVTVICSVVTVTEDATSYPIYDINAEARHGNYGDRDFARRSARGQYANR